MGRKERTEMLKHIVMFKFKDTAQGRSKAENLEAARARMLALKEEIPEIVDLEVYFGAPGSAPDNYDYILVSTFRNMEEMLRYQNHPSHVAFGQFVKELREPDGRVSIDYEV